MIKFKEEKLQEIQERKKRIKKHTIMVVDDEKGILETIKELLSKEYNIITASDGKEALDIILKMKNRESIAVIISDQKMPGLTGVNLFEKIKDIIPNTFRIILTAFDEKDIIIDSINKAKIHEFILKPFDTEELKLKLKHMVDKLEMDMRQSILIKRLLSPEVFKLLDSDPQHLNHRYLGVAVGFVDIRGYTQLVNRSEISHVHKLLTLYFDFVCQCISRYGGHIDKFIGDSVMWFHEGGEKDEICNSCAQVAVDIINGTKDLNIRIEKELHYRINIEVGVGVAFGNCSVGIYGAPDHRMQYSVFGPAVNLASRLCSEARPGEILVGGEIIGHCQYKTQPIGFRSIKGFDYEVEVRRILVPTTGRGKNKEKGR